MHKPAQGFKLEKPIDLTPDNFVALKIRGNSGCSQHGLVPGL